MSSADEQFAFTESKDIYNIEKNIGYFQSRIINLLAGRVGEQVFNTQGNQNFQQEMLTDSDEIFQLFSANESAQDDWRNAIEDANNILRYSQIDEHDAEQEIKKIIKKCYTEAYTKITEYKSKIAELAEELCKEIVLHHRQINRILDDPNKPKILYPFEQGPLEENETKKYGRYRYRYMYDYYGNKVDSTIEGTRDEDGNLEEID
jgi:ATP-dependent Zn protease